MCGENPYISGDGVILKGSPPHVRGKPSYYQVVGYIDKDHPRMCGENRGLLKHLSLFSGSPPHVRGKLTLIR